MTNPAPPPANYDEAKVGPYILPPLALDPTQPAPTDANAARATQRAWHDIFAQGLFGALPRAPDQLEWSRHPLSDAHCERIHIVLTVDGREMHIDAALWLPPASTGPVPIVVGLDFLGPLGTLTAPDYPLDQQAVIALPAWAGGGQGAPSEILRGTSAHRFPIPMLLQQGYAVLTSCYGSWAPDDPVRSRVHGLWPLLGLDQSPSAPGVVSLWSWAITRLIDVASALPDIDATQIIVAGHSRLGKAALWASVSDARVAALFLNQSGCGGAALSRRNFGETLAHNRHGFPHWLLSEEQAAAAGLDTLDQHQLLALMAPRRLYVASAADDLWCDPRGEYLGLAAAAPFWKAFGPQPDLPPAESIFAPGNQLVAGSVGWHLRAGGHELTPYDWSHFLAFLDKDHAA
ncbi:MAG TPA: hypothetical protein VL133_11760 [Devosia sp.]|nr:hypothetical protein [Devosia sp.]